MEDAPPPLTSTSPATENAPQRHVMADNGPQPPWRRGGSPPPPRDRTVPIDSEPSCDGPILPFGEGELGHPLFMSVPRGGLIQPPPLNPAAYTHDPVIIPIYTCKDGIESARMRQGWMTRLKETVVTSLFTVEEHDTVHPAYAAFHRVEVLRDATVRQWQFRSGHWRTRMLNQRVRYTAVLRELGYAKAYDAAVDLLLAKDSLESEGLVTIRASQGDEQNTSLSSSIRYAMRQIVSAQQLVVDPSVFQNTVAFLMVVIVLRTHRDGWHQAPLNFRLGPTPSQGTSGVGSRAS